MRPRPLLWLLLSLLCFAGAFYFWRLGNRWAADRPAAPTAATSASTAPARSARGLSPLKFLDQAGALNAQPSVGLTNLSAAVTNRFALRLTNTAAPMAELQREAGEVAFEIQPTAWGSPDVVLHVRPPTRHGAVRAVTVNGEPWKDFDGDTVRLGRLRRPSDDPR